VDEIDWSFAADFASLYGCGLDPVDESRHADQLPITGRMAYYLWLTATEQHDLWRGWARDFDPDDHDVIWRDDLPPLAQRHATAEWLSRFAQCFNDIGTRLRTGEFSDYGVTNCTADEVAVIITIDYARDLVVLGRDVGDAR
jgi:hypothetical protein